MKPNRVKITNLWISPFALIRVHTTSLSKVTKISGVRQLILSVLKNEISEWVRDEFDPEYYELDNFKSFYEWVKGITNDEIEDLAWGEVELVGEPEMVL